jgi:hypothetical protein
VLMARWTLPYDIVRVIAYANALPKSDNSSS